MRNRHETNTQNARRMRHAMTREELTLWSYCLRELPVRVRRQHQVGNFILDFYIPSKKLAIELDGSQHYSEEGEAADSTRTEFLNSKGITVVRYSNLDINQRFDSVCQDIYRRLGLDKGNN